MGSRSITRRRVTKLRPEPTTAGVVGSGGVQARLRRLIVSAVGATLLAFGMPVPQLMAATACDTLATLGLRNGTGTFALDHPEQLVDFAYRSAHEMTLAAKAIVSAFYGNGPRFSYWDGCSTGGRMALTEAQRFPDDFDGIIAGAPANFSSHQAAQMMSVALAVHPSPPKASARLAEGGQDDASYIPPAKYSLIHQAVLEACDLRDGVKDGVLEDPSRCAFDPKVLECKGDDAVSCLTPAQVVAAQKIYAPIVNPRTRQPIFPGLSPGSELAWGTVAGPQPLAFPREIYQFIVFRDPNKGTGSIDEGANFMCKTR